jgi:hypothetical protein
MPVLNPESPPTPQLLQEPCIDRFPHARLRKKDRTTSVPHRLASIKPSCSAVLASDELRFIQRIMSRQEKLQEHGRAFDAAQINLPGKPRYPKLVSLMHSISAGLHTPSSEHLRDPVPADLNLDLQS